MEIVFNCIGEEIFFF